MGTVTLRSATAPDSTYTRKNATLTHAEMDTNLTLFLRNDVSDTMSGTLSITGSLEVAGDITAYSNQVSDKRLKDDIVIIDSALDKIKAMRGVYFTWNSTSRKDKRDIGLIAQEVEEVIPEIVYEKNPFFIEGDEPVKTIDYDKVVAVLIEGIKEQQKQIEELTLIVESIKEG